jgi:hypothetical protein
MNYNTTRNYKSNEFLNSEGQKNYQEIQNRNIRLMFPGEVRRLMTEWELAFVESLKLFKTKWSDKQREMLYKIYSKYKNGKGSTKKSQKV